MTSVRNDATVAYVLAAQPAFEDLRQVASQMAGLLVLAATGSRESSPEHPMIALSKRVLAQAAEGVRDAGALVTEQARPHHGGMLDASSLLTRALSAAEAWPLDVDAVLVPLRDAYRRLQQASAVLPGFEMVSFEQACCTVRLKADATS